jgi:hypothetical protein
MPHAGWYKDTRRARAQRFSAAARVADRCSDKNTPATSKAGETGIGTLRARSPVARC